MGLERWGRSGSSGRLWWSARTHRAVAGGLDLYGRDQRRFDVVITRSAL